MYTVRLMLSIYQFCVFTFAEEKEEFNGITFCPKLKKPSETSPTTLQMGTCRLTSAQSPNGLGRHLVALASVTFAFISFTLQTQIFIAAAQEQQPQPLIQRAKYRSINGWGNNLEHPEWGAADTPFIRLQVPTIGYTNTTSQLTGTDRPSPRNISLALMGTDYPDKKRYTEAGTTDMLTYMGQFFDHDLDKTADGNATRDAAPIPIPRGDPFYDPKGLGNLTMTFTRSAYVKPNDSSYRAPINLITAFVDGSLVYGSSDSVADALRTHEGGRLRVVNESKNYGPMLPLVQSVNISTDYMANDANRVPYGTLRAAGDVRGNVDPPVLAFQTLFVREHNRLASELARQHPDWDDETLYQEARKWNIAYMQRVCFYEYIPNLGLSLPPYRGYNASVNPSIDVFFSTVSYRYGHSEVTDVILRIDDEGNEIPQGHLLLSRAYFNPNVSLSAGIDPVLRGLSLRVQGFVEPRFSQAVQNFLFGLPGVNGTDLFARNIQRGRDHGVPNYNTCRRDLGLQPVRTFEDLTDDPSLVKVLTDLYGTPDKCDAYVCGLAERKLPGSHFGPLFNASLTDQYLRVRDGDWYYFENNGTGSFNESEIGSIRGTSLRDIILRNTDIKVLPEDVWHVDLDQPWPLPSCTANASRGGGGDLSILGGAAVPQVATRQVSLLGGQYKLAWRFPSPDAVELTMSVPGAGWVGFGVAASPTSSMVGADIVMARVMPDGTAKIDDMWSSSFAAPQPDSQLGGSSQVQLVSAKREGGVTTVTFRRPLAASDKFDRALTKDGPNNIIVAWNPDTTDTTQYHGPRHRSVASVTLLSAANQANSAVQQQEQNYGGDFFTLGLHGVLMAIVFSMLLPLGVFCNRTKNASFLAGKAGVRQMLFYLHILFNMLAAVIAAVALGVVFARVKWLDFHQVPYSHGKLGVVIAALLFTQALYPWIRPAPVPLTTVRRVWELVHTTMGRGIIILGLVNVAIGIHLFTSLFGGSFRFFALLAAVPVASLALVSSIIDRLSWQSSHGVEAMDDRAAAIPTAAATDGRDLPARPIQGGKSIGSPAP